MNYHPGSGKNHPESGKNHPGYGENHPESGNNHLGSGENLPEPGRNQPKDHDQPVQMRPENQQSAVAKSQPDTKSNAVFKKPQLAGKRLRFGSGSLDEEERQNPVPTEWTAPWAQG